MATNENHDRMLISLIAAASENNVLGKDQDMVWHLPDDFKFFKRQTEGHYIIMGRKTFSYFDKPLPNRTSIVVTRNGDYTADGAIVTHSIDDAIEIARQGGEQEAFIIGGGEIYRQTLDRADRIYLTRVHATLEGDAFFPDFDESKWDILSEEYHEKDERHDYPFTIYIMERKGNGKESN